MDTKLIFHYVLTMLNFSQLLELLLQSYVVLLVLLGTYCEGNWWMASNRQSGQVLRASWSRIWSDRIRNLSLRSDCLGEGLRWWFRRGCEVREHRNHSGLFGEFCVGYHSSLGFASTKNLGRTVWYRGRPRHILPHLWVLCSVQLWPAWRSQRQSAQCCRCISHWTTNIPKILSLIVIDEY